MATKRLSGMSTSSSVPDNGGDHSGGGGSAGNWIDDKFSTYLYAGDDGTDRDIVNGIDLDGEGGLVWIRNRAQVRDHVLVDTERGIADGYHASNSKVIPDKDQKNVRAFNSDGFRVGERQEVNQLGNDYVSWTFRKAPNFFDCVTWTGDGIEGREIPHNLGVKPGIILVKDTKRPYSWQVYSAAMGSGKTGHLDSSEAFADDEKWAGTDPTDTAFYLSGISGTYPDGNEVNRVQDTYVAYLFAHDDSDESMIKCGSFTDLENSGASSQHIELGFEPQFILMKTTSRESAWYMWDTMRGMSEPQSKFLLANDSVAEAYIDSPFAVYPTPTGFRMPGFWGAGEEVIYMAIRRPNKPASEFEADELFAIDRMAQKPAYTSGFPVDMAIEKGTSSAASHVLGARLMQGKSLFTSESSAEGGASAFTFDFMDGWRNGNGDFQHVSWMWRRAPHFFDTVCYEGTQVAREMPHNLESVPEMMWVKSRTGSNSSWRIGGSKVGNGTNNALTLNTDQAMAINNTYWNNTAQTSSVFSLGASAATNGAGVDYIACLWASVPGVCSIGSYTGVSSDLDIDCGFTNGARYVLIKRTDAAGDWRVFDTLRGISDGQSSALLLNEALAQQVGSYIKPHPKGFTVTSNLTGINNGEYLYMAIA